jgi:hypothetical protein
MNARLYASIAVVLILYLSYCWYMYDPMFKFRNFQAEGVTNMAPHPTPSVPLMEHTVAAPPAGAGAAGAEGMKNPSSTPPMQPFLAPHKKPQRGNEETPYDTQENTFESAQIPERLRHPERSFSPGYVNDETSTAVASGVASYSAAATRKAEQTFGPEFVQNGGQFMEGGVTANDDSLSVSYSGF